MPFYVRYFEAALAILMVSSLSPAARCQSANVDQGQLETIAAQVFATAFRSETGRSLKRIHIPYLQEGCAAEDFKRVRWDGMYTFSRIDYADKEKLENEMSALIRQWKTTGANGGEHFRSLFPSEFPNIRRYAVVSCGPASSTNRLVVAVFPSAWSTYWSNWATLLGK